MCDETKWPANLTMARTDDDFDEFCSVGDSLHADDNKEPARNMHCSCWYDGDGCCRCKAPAMTVAQREAQGME
jgi:hypothetical protein